MNNMEKKLKEGRMPVPNHEKCVNHIGGICGDVLAFVMRNDPDRLSEVVEEVSQ